MAAGSERTDHDVVVIGSGFGGGVAALRAAEKGYMDGSTVPSNLGVNPSLTITALAERAMSTWPNAGDEDPRPASDESYRRVAPGALRLPLHVVPT